MSIIYICINRWQICVFGGEGGEWYVYDTDFKHSIWWLYILEEITKWFLLLFSEVLGKVKKINTKERC